MSPRKVNDPGSRSSPVRDAGLRRGVHVVLVERDKSRAMPEPVARLAERILNHPWPNLRYPVGMPSQRIVVPLRRILPQRTFEWLARRLLGL